MSFLVERSAVDADGWRRTFEQAAQAGGRLGTLWGTDEGNGAFAVHALLVVHARLLWLSLPAADSYPDVSHVFPAAARLQRAVADLLGLRAGEDTRGWLRHGAWDAGSFPLRKDVPREARLPEGDARYAFVAVEGDGVHEIPVGPVHAGII